MLIASYGISRLIKDIIEIYKRSLTNILFKTSFRLPNCSLRRVNRNELITTVCVLGDIYNRK